jgi:ATP-binding cassette, subfamily B, bacterial
MISGPTFGMRYIRDDEITRQQIKPGTLRRILPYATRYKAPLAFLLGITALDSAILVVSPLILRLIIDNGILRHRASTVVDLSLTVAGLAILDAATTYIKSWYSAWIGESLVMELRASVFAHLQRQPLAFFTRTQTGSLVSRLNNDINGTQQAVGLLLHRSVSMLLNLVLVLAAMFWLSWQLSLIALVVIPLFLVPGKLISKRSQRLVREEMQLQAELSTMTTERSNVAGALLAKLYGRPAEEATLFTNKAGRIRDLAVANASWMQLLMVLVGLLAALVTALVYGLGGALVIHGVFQVGTLVAFIALVSQLYGPLNTVSSLQTNVITALVSFDRVFEILDLKPLITERPAAIALKQKPAVELDGVWFRYPAADEVSLASLRLPVPEHENNDAWVLKDITFTAPEGKLTALVGPSGAGKTTITHLVPRLYDAVRGTVRVGGLDVRDLTMASLRDTIGVVPQDAHLWHDTIRANLLYARPSATEKELIEACRAARIWDLISGLPDGLDTVAGDRGYRLSGGEKQRVALARLLLKEPSVVVLDEATAHLDSESEVAIQRALQTALAGRTSLVIAHRLSTIRRADQILVVDDGRITERGTHDELLADGRLYAELYRTQFARLAPRELRDYIGRAHRLGEHRVVVADRVLVLGDRRGRRAVGQRDHLVPVLVAGPHRRLHAAVGEETAENDRRDALAAQDEVEVRAGERVEAALALDEDVAVLRREFVDDGRAPAALHERAAVDDALEDAVRVPAELVVAGRERDRRVHDRHAGRAGGVDHPARVLQHVGLVHHLGDRAVQDAAVGGELVLVLNQHDGCGGRVKGHSAFSSRVCLLAVAAVGLHYPFGLRTGEYPVERPVHPQPHRAHVAGGEHADDRVDAAVEHCPPAPQPRVGAALHALKLPDVLHGDAEHAFGVLGHLRDDRQTEPQRLLGLRAQRRRHRPHQLLELIHPRPSNHLSAPGARVTGGVEGGVGG